MVVGGGYFIFCSAFIRSEASEPIHPAYQQSLRYCSPAISKREYVHAAATPCPLPFGPRHGKEIEPCLVVRCLKLAYYARLWAVGRIHMGACGAGYHLLKPRSRLANLGLWIFVETFMSNLTVVFLVRTRAQFS